MSDNEDTEKDGKKAKDNIKDILAALTEREKKALEQQFGLDLENDPDLEKTAKKYLMTREQLREIEKKALNKLRDITKDDD